MFRAVLFCVVLTVLAGCAASGPEMTTFYPPLPQQPRLQYLTSITSEEDLGAKASALREFVVGKEAVRSVARPYAIGSVKGKLYVSDRTLKRIMIVDLEKREIDYIREARLGALKDPFGLHVTADGYKYVADGERRQIVVFGPDDGYVRAYGEEGQFERPMDVAVFGEKLYVVDFPRHAVLAVDKESGKTVQTIGGFGAEPGQMNRPSHVRVDRNGNIYVNDALNFRIQKFDPQGNYLKEYGYSGATLGGFARPKGIDISRDGHLYVVDAAFQNVQIFDDESADLLLFFGTYGTSAGSLYLPAALHIDEENIEYFREYFDADFKVRYLIIASSLLGSKKINIYGFGDWVGEKLPEMGPRKPVEAEKPGDSATPATPPAGPEQTVAPDVAP